MLLLVGCKQATPPTAFGVDLTIDFRSLDRSSLTSLEVVTTGAESTTNSVALDAKLAAGGIVRVRYVPLVTTGSITFNVEAIAGATIAGTGSALATLTAGVATQLPITLTSSTPQQDMGADMLPSHCTNGTKDEDESDVDCGGSCVGCEPDKACMTATDCATATCTSNVCELASGPPDWLAVADMPAGRDLMGAWGADDGVYVAGGAVNGIADSSLRYDDTLDAWCGTCGTEVVPGNLVTAREGLASAYADTLYAFGGDDGVMSTFSSIEKYDVTSGMWSALTSSTITARTDLAAAIGSDGLVYVVGGRTDITSGAASIVATVETFNPQTGAVAAGTAMTAKREYPAAADDAMGRIVVTGGSADNATSLGTVEIWDPKGTAWTMGPMLPTPVNAHGSVRGADDRIYVFGGHTSAGQGVATAVALGLNADHWTTVPSLLSARAGIGAARAWDGRIYAIGGVDDTPALVAHAEAYGPKVALGPAQGPTATSVAISLSNFAANANVTVTLAGNGVSSTIGQGTTDATGEVKPSIDWHVPAVSPGMYIVTAVDDHARYPVRATFTVQ